MVSCVVTTKSLKQRGVHSLFVAGDALWNCSDTV